MGSGRSGTSMVTGTLCKAGYFMGDNLWDARDANPKGFFEDSEINQINEDLLAPVIPKRLNIPGSTRLKLPVSVLFRHHPINCQRWLARIPLNTQISSLPDISERIKKITHREPYCLKDPRFSYTLPAWKPYLKKDTVFVCVFRDPASTASSILKECTSASYLNHPHLGIKISHRQALEIWSLMYQHILEKHRKDGEWLFLHYNQAFTSDGLQRLAKFANAPVDYSFPDSRIRRTFSKNDCVPRSLINIYQTLCSLSNYED